MDMIEAKRAAADEFRQAFDAARRALAVRMVGHNEIIEHALIALVAGGHVLLEGVPGLGKTLLVNTLAEAAGLDSARIQFTPDLMPGDIVGTSLIVDDPQRGKQFRFQPGPVFTHLLLADEINRATPKTQSALLEAMQEGKVTTGGSTHPLPRPFLVMATQNPIEMEGTYPLPEAQLDRFFFKLLVLFPTAAELHDILERTTGTSIPVVEKVIAGAEQILRFRELAREVPVAEEVRERAVRLVLATHPQDAGAGPKTKRMVRYGASPRGAQTLLAGAKILALLDGRFHVAREDIDRLAPAALRHRILLNFEGEAAGITSEEIVAEALATQC